MKEEKYLTIRDSVVRQSNSFILNKRFKKFKLSMQQQKIMFFLTSRIQPDDKDFEEYTFKIVDFCRVCGLDSVGGHSYEIIKDSVQALADKSVWVKKNDDEKDDTEILLRFIDKAEISKESGTIKVVISDDMKPYLLQLRKNYTSFELLYTLRFKKKASPRLYEILKSRHYDKLKPYIYEIEVEQLRELLNADDKETYKEYRYFNKMVIKPAVKEINEQTDITVTYTPKRNGKSIESLIFTIETKPPIERLRIGDEVDEAFGNPQLTLAYNLNQKEGSKNG